MREQGMFLAKLAVECCPFASGRRKYRRNRTSTAEKSWSALYSKSCTRTLRRIDYVRRATLEATQSGRA
jgi:hypothetical protein